MPLSRGESLLLAYNRRDYGSGAAIIETIDKTPTCCFDLWTRVEELERWINTEGRNCPSTETVDAILHPDRLQDADVVSGALAQRFKDERNIARARVEELEQVLREIARTWPNAKRSGRRPSLSAEEAQRRANTALHPDQRETT